MTSTPLVSVVCASYNMGQYVGEAVDSVLAQDYPALEMIVVDDGSTDDTQQRLARFAGDARVKVIRQENQGQTVAKNRGLKEATGDLIGFCDADNRWMPGKLARQ
ncbi:MAG TPA: glycosyltransferase family A protein, partial [Candidatus Krumholzibacteria bacterium]|nr:glycosyltransferase family A protein [Candidatus Krumholzibacteria bacterium]